MNHLDIVFEQKKASYLETLKELVAIDTHCLGHGIKGGLEKKGQEYMIALFENMGANQIHVDQMEEAIIQKSIQLNNEGNPNHNYTDRFNVHARFLGNGGRSLLFNGHMDTMPAGNLEAWTNSPHEPTIKDGKLYGLGAADMKAGLLAATLAVKFLKDAGEELPGDVIISSVVDEEGGGNGSIQAAMQGYKADGVVVCEPSTDELILAHMGFVFFRIKVKGHSNHSGAKWKGISAIDKSIKLIKALNELEHSWLLQYKHPLLPPPNLNVGVIRGGTAGSIVPGECFFEICVHYLPKLMSYNQIKKEVEDQIFKASQGDDWLSKNLPDVEIYQAGGGFEQDAKHPIVASFQKAYQETTGSELKISGSPAGCDSRIWKNIAGCETIQFGPGRLEECHAIDEYVEIESFYRAIKVYAQFIMNWGKKNLYKQMSKILDKYI